MEIKRKGIIFALDAALAVSVVIIILINSSYYFSTASKESLSQLQPVRIGGDIMALLDFMNYYNYAFKNDAEDTRTAIPQTDLNVSAFLPKNYAMYYAITDMKETPTTNVYCPDGPGLNEICATSAGVGCSPTGCTLGTGAWIQVKPFTLPTGTANIMNRGNHFVMIKTSPPSSSLSATINVDDNWTASLVNFDAHTGIFLWGAPYRPYFEPGNGDYNWINITNTGGTSFTLEWVRVVGDESYMRGAFSDETITSIPLDRFVGSGERFIGILDKDGYFEGYHLVRYWVWLKTVGS